jgi:hypothetical protein
MSPSPSNTSSTVPAWTDIAQVFFHFHLVIFSWIVPTLVLLPSVVEELEQQRVYAIGQQHFGQLHEPLCDNVSECVRLASAASFTGTYTHTLLSPMFTRLMTHSSAVSCSFAPHKCLRFWRLQPVTWRHRCVSFTPTCCAFLKSPPTPAGISIAVILAVAAATFVFARFRHRIFSRGKKGMDISLISAHA